MSKPELDPLVALAATVAEMRGRLDRLEGGLEVVASQTGEAGHARAEVAALAELVTTMGDRLSELADVVAASSKPAPAGQEQAGQEQAGQEQAGQEQGYERPDPRPWAALVKEGAEEGSPFHDLVTWLNSVFIPQYDKHLIVNPHPRWTLPKCWARHPAIANELWTLYVMWDAAYVNPDAAPRDGADWHDRWMPGALERIAALYRHCTHEPAKAD